MECGHGIPYTKPCTTCELSIELALTHLILMRIKERPRSARFNNVLADFLAGGK